MNLPRHRGFRGKQKTHLLVLILLLNCQTALAGNCTAPVARYQLIRDEQSPRPDQDKISISIEKSRVKLSIKHVSGIGTVAMKRVRGKWQQEVLLRFINFKELEGLTIKHGAHNESLHITSSNISDLKNGRIRKNSTGIFVTLSHKMFDANEDLLQISWVDYYR